VETKTELTVTDIGQFMENLKTSAKIRLTSKLIENLQMETQGISKQFKSLTFDITNKIIEQLSKKKPIKVQPNDIIDGVKDRAFKPSVATILKKWIQVKVKEAIKLAKKEGRISEYVNFKLEDIPEDDIKLLSEAIYGKMHLELSNSKEKSSVLEPFKAACLQAKDEFIKKFSEKIAKKNPKKPLDFSEWVDI
jgi:hypothetical protein